MTKRTLSVTLAGLALVAAVGLGLRGTASRAQTPVEEPPAVSESLEQKVARLERQVTELQKQVAELKRRPALTVAPTPPNLHYNFNDPSYPPGATPFLFNGETYYHVPIRHR